MTAVSHLQKQAPSRIKRTRNEIQRPGRLSNGRESAGIAVNVAAVFDVAHLPQLKNNKVVISGIWD